ncbi:MAG TPA: hypothetical protein VIK91_08370, partial [Nannocystis sp.]
MGRELHEDRLDVAGRSFGVRGEERSEPLGVEGCVELRVQSRAERRVNFAFCEESIEATLVHRRSVGGGAAQGVFAQH